MKHSLFTSLLALMVSILVLVTSACGISQATPTETVNPTVAAETPTAAPTIEATPEPTVTPTPTPVITPSPTPQLSPEEYVEQFTQRIFELVNQAREDNGLEPLELSPALCAAAAIRADEYRQKMEAANPDTSTGGYFTHSITSEVGHSRMNGDNFSTVLDEVNVTRWDWAGENLDCMFFSGISVQRDAEDAFRWWKNSSGHWKNILDTDWKETGISVYCTSYGFFACELFTSGHKEPKNLPDSTPSWTWAPDETAVTPVPTETTTP